MVGPPPAAPMAIEEAVRFVIAGGRLADKAGTLVSFVPNRHQRRLIAAMMQQVLSGRPVRLIVLKARQLGVSTASEAVMFGLVNVRPNRRAFVCAHDDEASTTLFRRNQRFQAELARPRATQYSSRKEIVYGPPHSSQFHVQTAGTTTLQRGSTLHYVHVSELAFWPAAGESLLSLLQTVPDAPDTMVVIESTANGVGGEYYSRWQRAVAEYQANPAEAEYMPLFFSWLEADDEYSMPVPAGYEFGPLDADEEFLVGLGATPEQLYWRRRTIIGKCGGDADRFKQEYPATPEEAFRTSGRRAIAEHIVREHHRQAARAKPRRGRFHWANDDHTRVTLGYGDWGSHYWLIYAEPTEWGEYVFGGDVAEGSLSDPQSPSSDADYSAGCVIERRESRTAATWHGRTDADLFGEELLKAAIYYNHAWGSPEANSAGVASTLVFKRANYSRLYRRGDMSDLKVETMDASQLGWKTTAANRDNLIDDWLAAIRPDDSGGDRPDFAGAFCSLDRRLAEEEDQFEYDKTGKRQHRPGGHDDMLFAHMIAWQMHLRCPRTTGRRVMLDSGPRRLLGFDGEIDVELDTA